MRRVRAVTRLLPCIRALRDRPVSSEIEGTSWPARWMRRR